MVLGEDIRIGATIQYPTNVANGGGSSHTYVFFLDIAQRIYVEAHCGIHYTLHFVRLILRIALVMPFARAILLMSWGPVPSPGPGMLAGGAMPHCGVFLTEQTESLIADKTKFPKTPNSRRPRDLHNHLHPHPTPPRQPTPPDSQSPGAKMRGKRSKQYRKLMEQ